MPDCAKCNIHFSNSIKIDGVVRNMQNRRFCLSCSPFKKHNTRDITKSDPSIEGSKHCNKCDRTLLIEEFYWKEDGVRLAPYCKECSNTLSNVRQQNLKLQAVNYKGGKCIVCGYSACLAALVFHHIDPEQKDFSISHFKCASFEKIAPELDKCVLLCSRCHQEHHVGFIDLEKFINLNGPAS